MHRVSASFYILPFNIFMQSNSVSEEFYSFLRRHNPFHDKKLVFGDDFSIDRGEYEIAGVGVAYVGVEEFLEKDDPKESRELNETMWSSGERFKKGDRKKRQTLHAILGRRIDEIAEYLGRDRIAGIVICNYFSGKILEAYVKNCTSDLFFITVSLKTERKKRKPLKEQPREYRWKEYVGLVGRRLLKEVEAD